MFRNPRILALSAAFAAMTPNVGALAPASAATTTRVSYGDLDLGTSIGQAQLTRRLRRAATNVCAAYGQLPLAETMACRTDAVSRARTDLSAIVGGASPTVLR